MTDDLRDRIINAIWDDLIVQRDSDIPFAPSVSRSDSYIDGEVDIESVADAVIAELRPQLAAWARMCVSGGDMTPAAQRMLHTILGQP